MPVAGPQPPSTGCFARWILHRDGKHLHLWGGVGGIFMGALQFTEKINSEVVAGSVLLWMREAPPRALCEHGVINGVAWAREGGGLGLGPGTRRCPVALGAHLDKESVCLGRVGTRGRSRRDGFVVEEPARARSPPKASAPTCWLRGALPRQTSPWSFNQLFMAGVCLLNGIVPADDFNCTNKILIARSPRVPAAVGVAELSAAPAGPGPMQSPRAALKIPSSTVLRF